MPTKVLSHVRHACLKGAEQRLPLHATLLSKQWFRKAAVRHATWLIYAGEEDEPRFVVRQAIHPAGNDDLLREVRVLRDVAAWAPSPIAPRVLDTATIDGLSVVTIEYISGARSVSAELAQAYRTGELESERVSDLFSRHFAMASAALSLLQEHAPVIADVEAADAEAGQLLHEALSWFGPEHRNQMALTRGALELVFETVSEAASPGKRLVHFDLSAGNLVSSGGAALMVDWEAARESTFWWFDPLKFLYTYISELTRFGAFPEVADSIEAFFLFLEGKLETLEEPSTVFLKSSGFPVHERDTMRAFWLAYALREMQLFLGVCETPGPQLAPYGRLIGRILDLGDSPGGVQEQLEKLGEEHAALQERLSGVLGENRSLQGDMERLAGLLDQERARASGLEERLQNAEKRVVQFHEELSRTREELSRTREELSRVGGELTEIWESKLWKAGSLYWRVLSGLGFSSGKRR